jgi:hypothetical protein
MKRREPKLLLPGARFSLPLRYVRVTSQLFQLLGRERYA